ncbi:MAG: oligosaccharide flippase family protein [Planctomycetes bacterium]|nr:oligosaccharide flippase family protein [Planctomycetota bacterium]
MTGPLAGGVALNVASRAGAALAQLGTIAILTRHLGGETYGKYAVVVFVLNTAVVVAVLGFPITISRYAALYAGREDAARLARLLGWGGSWCAAAGLATGAALWALSARLAEGYGDAALALPLRAAAVAVPLATLAQAVLGAARGLGRFDSVSAATAAAAVLTLAGALWVGRSGGGPEAMVGVHGLAWALVLAVLGGTLARHLGAGARGRATPLAGERLGRYLAAASVLAWLELVVWKQSELLFLGHLGLFEEAALYAVAFGLSGTAMAVLPNATAEVLTPEFARLAGGGRDEDLRRLYPEATRWVAVVAFPVAAGGAALARPLLGLLLPGASEPRDAVVLAVLLAGGTVGALAVPAGAVLLARGALGRLLGLWLAAGALNLLLDLVLIPGGGALGAATACALAQAALGAALLATASLGGEGLRVPWSAAGRAALAAGCMGVLVRLGAGGSEGAGWLVAAVLGGGVAYGALALVFGAVTRAEAMRVLQRARRAGGGQG